VRAVGVVLLALAMLVPALANAALNGTVPGGGQPTPAPNASGPLPGGKSTSPFSTPEPPGTPGPIGNGFVILGYDSAAASGGIIPLREATAAPPSPFPASNSSGFFAEIAGRLSKTYAATLRFHDYVVHGADMPVVDLSEGALWYQPGGGVFALGLGYGSWQRSTSTTSANGAGIGAALLPDTRRPISPYASFVYYPSATTLGTTASISAAQAGVMLRPGRSGVLVQLGYDYIGYPNQSLSPSSLSGLQFGVGVRF